MSILTDFLSSYKPVQAIRLPLSSYLYKSNAVSGLADLTTKEFEALSNNLSDYALCAHLSAGINTNKLSAGILSVDTAVFSVEHVTDYDRKSYDVIKVNGTRFYNIGGDQIVQSVLPRRELDARITIFEDPDQRRYFKLVALVDDRSMVDPDYIQNINIDVVEVTSAEVDYNENKYDTYERVYIRVPGENERYSVNYLYIGYSDVGEPRIEVKHAVDDLKFKLGQVVDGIVFTGESIQTNGEYQPERITMIYDGGRTDKDPGIWLLPDSEYAQNVVEDEMRVFNSRTNARVDKLDFLINSLSDEVSAFKDAVADEILSLQDKTTELSSVTLNKFNDVAVRLSSIDDALSAVNVRADETNQRINALSNQLLTQISRLDSNVASINQKINALSGIIDQNTHTLQILIEKLSAIDQLSPSCTVEDERLAINEIISASYCL